MAIDESSSAMVNRRAFLSVGAVGAGAALATACAPAAAPPAAPAAPAQGGAPAGAAANPGFKAEWDKLVEAARKEGKVNIFFSGAGPGFTKIGQEFEAEFPGIKAEITALSTASLFLPRIFEERKAGLYNFDLATVQAPYAFSKDTLRDAGALEPIRPLLMHPEVLDDKAWPGGIENSWVDNDKKWAFAFSWQIIGLLWINTDLVKEGEIKTARDIANPKWKGKIMSADPRTHGQGWIPATVISMKYGNDLLKQIWVDQEPALSRETRQITEALVRGRYAMAFGVTPAELQPFAEQGLGKNIKGLVIDSAAPLVRPLEYINRAPHPNAAKLFANWFLTKQGATAWATNTQLNSRRNDAPVVDKLTWVDPAVNHPVIMDSERMMDKPLEVSEYFKKVMA